MRRGWSLRRVNRSVLIALAAVAVLALIVRASLPYFAERFINTQLNAVPGFQGHVEDVDLHLWRGAMSLHGLQVSQIKDSQSIPTLDIDTIDASIQWKMLFHGAIVGEIELYRPRANVIAGEQKEQARGGDAFADQFRGLMPININRFAVIDGEIHFRNPNAKPEVDIYVDQVQVEVRNLANSERVAETLAATATGNGRAMQSGHFTVDMKLDPFAKQPTYELAFEMKDLELPELNGFLRHYLAVEARDGTFSMAAESTANEGRFKGYVKPAVHDLDILYIKKPKTFGEAIKGFFVKIIDAVFENKPNQQVATRVEFEGTFENPDVSVWSAVASFLRNAFVSALDPSLEGTVAPEQAKKAEQNRERRFEKGRKP
jgi:hypothetical protein